MTADLAASGSKVIALSFGPDTATYNIRPTDRDFEPVKQELSAELQEAFDALKKQAKEVDKEVPTRWVFEDQTLFMQDRGGSQFKWILKNDKITLCIGRGKKTGIIGQLRLNSEYLWDCDGDLGLALTKAYLFLCSLYGEHILLDQSTLDLAVDVLGLDLSAQDIKEQFISRAILDDENPSILGGGDGFLDGPSCIHRRWKKITEEQFAEMEREKEELLAEVDAYLEKHPFLTPNTCKRVTPRRREQAATPVVAPAPCDNRPFIRQRKREVNMEQGIRQVVGWLSTIEAWRGGYAIDQKALENAVKWSLVPRNVASLATVPRKSSHEVQALSADDARKLIEAAQGSRIEALLILAVTTDMRRGELLGLRWDDIDLEQRVLYIRRTMNRIAGFGFIENDPKTKASRRRVMLPHIAVEALRKHRIRQDQAKQQAETKWTEKGLVFPNTVGNFLNPDHLLTMFQKVLDQAGLPRMRFHDLRHSAAYRGPNCLDKIRPIFRKIEKFERVILSLVA